MVTLHSSSEKTARSLASWWAEPGNPESVVAWGRKEGVTQQEEGVHSVGLRSRNHTAKELMHQSEEIREAPPMPPPTIHVAGDPLQAQTVHQGQGWAGAAQRNATSHPLSISPFQLHRLVCARWQGWGGLGRSVKRVGAVGAGFKGGAIAALVPLPLYTGGSLQSTISRSFL